MFKIIINIGVRIIIDIVTPSACPDTELLFRYDDMTRRVLVYVSISWFFSVLLIQRVLQLERTNVTNVLRASPSTVEKRFVVRRFRGKARQNTSAIIVYSGVVSLNIFIGEYVLSTHPLVITLTKCPLKKMYFISDFHDINHKTIPNVLVILTAGLSHLYQK